MQNGWPAFTDNKRPVRTPDDLKGLKIRSTPNPYHIQAFKLLGMNPSPMPVSELYTALESGTFDAQEHPINVTWSSKFYEVQRHLTVSNHVYSPLILAMNKAKFDSLPANVQTIVVDAAREAAKYQRELNAQNAGKVLTELKKSGMQVVENVDMAPFQKIVSDSIAKAFTERTTRRCYRLFQAQSNHPVVGGPQEGAQPAFLSARRNAAGADAQRHGRDGVRQRLPRAASSRR